LKNLTSDNSRTKVVALGIGNGIRLNELNRIVSEPADRNAIPVYNFSSLHDVEDRMMDAICSGWFSLLIILVNFIAGDNVLFCMFVWALDDKSQVDFNSNWLYVNIVPRYKLLTF